MHVRMHTHKHTHTTENLKLKHKGQNIQDSVGRVIITFPIVVFSTEDEAASALKNLVFQTVGTISWGSYIRRSLRQWLITLHLQSQRGQTVKPEILPWRLTPVSS